ncbi:hypothetical protein [Paenibacillus herberti]|uniref:Uncharacterized protein n=1 Tax=Paenibacillus herberti TaxID=1619309 RepID=A0A229P4V7_9BACL|nr:hypothetical protein [Paenibacillus herberti]OXM17316.1 hypothetical protein CGZ75_12135 [Paenibacillus herberti]
MAVYAFLTGNYARDIFLYGNRAFPNIRVEYVQPVKQYAAATYSYDQVDNAKAKGWVTEQEHAATEALMPPRPVQPEPEPTPDPPVEPGPPVVIPTDPATPPVEPTPDPVQPPEEGAV